MYQVVRCYPFAAADATDPYFANTVLLLSGDGANGTTTFTDESFAAHGDGFVWGAGAANGTVSTATKVHGTGSIQFDSARNDHISWGDHADWTLGSEDFTIEGFFLHGQNTFNEALIGHYSVSTTGQRGWAFDYIAGSTPDVLRFIATSDGSTVQVVVSGTWTPTPATWYYYCAERSGNTFRIYTGEPGGAATMLAKATNSLTIFNSNKALTLGYLVSDTVLSSEEFYGNMDEIRITKGVARYASDAGFAVPTAAFPRS